PAGKPGPRGQGPGAGPRQPDRGRLRALRDPRAPRRLGRGLCRGAGPDRPEGSGRRDCRVESRRKGRCGAGIAEGRARGEIELKGTGEMPRGSRFSLNRRDKKLAGVCSTLGEVFNLDPTFIRIGFVATAILISWKLALIAYVAAGIYLHIQKNRANRLGERKSDFERMAGGGRGRASIHALRTELDATDRRMMAIDHHLNAQKNHELAREID